jgi:hypothetical protein
MMNEPQMFLSFIYHSQFNIDHSAAQRRHPPSR